MNDAALRPLDCRALYQRAFDEFGAVALWNVDIRCNLVHPTSPEIAGAMLVAYRED